MIFVYYVTFIKSSIYSFHMQNIIVKAIIARCFSMAECTVYTVYFHLAIHTWERTSASKLLYSWVLGIQEWRLHLLNLLRLGYSCLREGETDPSGSICFWPVACLSRMLRAIGTVVCIWLSYICQIDLVRRCVGDSHVVLEKFLLLAVADSRRAIYWVITVTINPLLFTRRTSSWFNMRVFFIDKVASFGEYVVVSVRCLDGEWTLTVS